MAMNIFAANILQRGYVPDAFRSKINSKVKTILTILFMYTEILSYTHAIRIILLTAVACACLLTPSAATAERASQFIAGGNTTFILKNDKNVSAWGANKNGELGNGTTEETTKPVDIVKLINIRSIASGDNFTIALKEDGTVIAWGENSYGQLGDGTTVSRPHPAPVPGMNDIIAIAAGGCHALALKSDGTIYSWGDNSYGQLGDGSTVIRSTPVIVSELKHITAIATGGGHSVALNKEGRVVTWGRNNCGQLGDGTSINKNKPLTVPGLNDVSAITAGAGFTVILKNDGTVAAWGDNYHGQLGIGTTIQQNTPMSISGLGGIVSIASGAVHVVALKNDGSVYTWGGNAFGQLGNNSTVQSTVPLMVPTLKDITSITSGMSHVVALKNDGTLVSWGGNTFGQIGNGTTTDQLVPVTIKKFAVKTVSVPPHPAGTAPAAVEQPVRPAVQQSHTSAPAASESPSQQPSPPPAPAAPSAPAIMGSAQSPPTSVAALAALHPGQTVAVVSEKQPPAVTDNKQANAARIAVVDDGIEITSDAGIDTYKVFLMKGPTRLVIDINGATTINGRSVEYSINRLGIDHVRLGSHPGRLRVVLQSPLEHFPKYREIKLENGLKLSIAPEPVETVNTPTVPATEKQNQTTDPRHTTAPTQASATTGDSEKKGFWLSDTTVPLYAVKQDAGACSNCNTPSIVKTDIIKDGIEITSDGDISSYITFMVGSPSRLVMDICCASSETAGKAITYNNITSDKINMVLVGPHAEKLRIILQSSLATFPAYRISKINRGIRLYLDEQ